MVHACQFVLAPPPSSSTTNQTMSQMNPGAAIPPPTSPTVAGTDVFYIIIALSVLVRVIVSPPNQRQK